MDNMTKISVVSNPAVKYVQANTLAAALFVLHHSDVWNIIMLWLFGTERNYLRAPQKTNQRVI